MRRVLICSGKVFFDLYEYREKHGINNVAIIRCEQISPFPYIQVKEELERYPNAEVCWVQEEHRNAGAWRFMKSRLGYLLSDINRGGLTYRGRNVSGSPATGSLNVHNRELEKMLVESFDDDRAK